MESQEFTVYCTYTKYITIRVFAESQEEAIDRAVEKYDYHTASEVEEDETLEMLDTYLSFDDVEESV